MQVIISANGSQPGDREPLWYPRKVFKGSKKGHKVSLHNMFKVLIELILTFEVFVDTIANFEDL